MSNIAAPPSNLPAALSSFVGRRREIAEVEQLLASHRLVTLTGQGGCGKTRLALQVAGDRLAEMPGGVWLVEFAPIAQPALVPQTVATTLGLHEQPGCALTVALVDYLRARRLLLVFDNCEHLVAACGQLADTLLRGCPELRLLATSREPMGVPGEQAWTVPPLSLPDPQPWRGPSSGPVSLLRYQASEAIGLFVVRATEASPDFRLTEQNAGWIGNVCRRLDGMPLAIELAAARVRALSVQQIAERLDDRFRLLTGGSRTAPARQQTLAAALDWSYALLPEAEQTILQRLSIFIGGLTLPAAEAVCAGRDIAASAVLDLLARLVDKSLVVAERQSGEMRYRLLETIREYALERLLASGQSNAVRRRHAEFFLSLAQQTARTDTRLVWPEQLTTVNRLEVEHDNLRAALGWAQTESGAQELGLQLARALAQFWQMRGYVGEGRAWLETFLAQNSSAPAALRAEALFLAGYLHIYSSDIVQAAPLLEQALALYQKLGDASGCAWQVVWLGWVAVAQGDYARAAELGAQGHAALLALGDSYGAAVALFPAGEAAYLLGDLALAAQAYQDSLALMRQVRNLWAGGRRLIRLGQIAHRQGDLPRSLALIREGLAACMDGGDYSGVAMALAAIAGVTRAEGDWERAVRLLGAVAALQQQTGAPLWFVDRVEFDRSLAGLRAQAGDPAFDAAWAAGQALLLPAALQLALEPIVARDTAARRAAAAEFGGLTEREREVAMLIAQGKSNRQIAEAMVVGVRTVETYVTRILSKLGLDSRVQIATWAIEKGLAAPSSPA